MKAVISSGELIVLGIETSCDETALALVRVSEDGSSQVIVEVISSQIALHELYGGVVPELASREHLQSLPTLFLAIEKSHPHEFAAVGLIAVTSGPGLKGCLLMGINFASALSLTKGIPMVAVNHIEGHIFSAFLNSVIPGDPFFSLVVSGGHTELIFVEKIGVYEKVARTIDDAAGEAFDKSAYLLGFAYPGGRALAEAADNAGHIDFGGLYKLPKIMREAEGFSFSGLKTAVRQLIEKHQPMTEKTKTELTVVIQDSIIDALLFKLRKALDGFAKPVQMISVVGGVSANRKLRQGVTAGFPTKTVVFPELRYSTDNAAMIALVGGLRFLKGLSDMQPITSVSPRWPVETIATRTA